MQKKRLAVEGIVMWTILIHFIEKINTYGAFFYAELVI